MPKYNLSELTEFSQALVYGFEPETHPQADNGQLDTIFYFPISQHADVLEGYLYAQSILPELKLGLDKVQPEQFIEWIKGIHQRIGKNLVAAYGETSGEFSKRPVVHWESSGEIQGLILAFLSGHMKKTSLPAFVDLVNSELGVNKKELTAFMKILSKVGADKTIKLSPMQRAEEARNKGFSYEKGTTILTKLQAAYHCGKLSTDEMKAVDRIVRLCAIPDNIPAIMKKYSEDFVADLKKVDPKNLDSVVDFIAEKFFGLTFTHPFVNANGRTATCVMNLFLRAFGYPSILLRYPSERDNPNSSYSKAFAQVNENRDLLKAHIKQRILDEGTRPYTDSALKEINELRVAALTIYQRIAAKHPGFDLLKAHYSVQEKASQFIDAIEDGQKQSLFLLKHTIKFMVQIEKELDAKLVKKALPTGEDILAKLVAVSGQSNWKGYKNNTVFVLENPSEELVAETARRLKACDAMKLTQLRRADNKMPVLKVEEINVQRLLAFEVESSANKPLEEEMSRLTM